MAEIPHNSSRLFIRSRNDDLVREVLFLKLVNSGFEIDTPDRRDIINRMMEPIGAHRWKAFVANHFASHKGLVSSEEALQTGQTTVHGGPTDDRGSKRGVVVKMAEARLSSSGQDAPHSGGNVGSNPIGSESHAA